MLIINYIAVACISGALLAGRWPLLHGWCIDSASHINEIGGKRHETFLAFAHFSLGRARGRRKYDVFCWAIVAERLAASQKMRHAMATCRFHMACFGYIACI